MGNKRSHIAKKQKSESSYILAQAPRYYQMHMFLLYPEMHTAKKKTRSDSLGEYSVSLEIYLTSAQNDILLNKNNST